MFWAGFAAGWLIYFGISFSFAIVDSGRLGWSLGLASVNTGPPMAVAVLVAVNRRRLFRAEWSTLRTVLVHLGVGALFACLTGGLLMLALALTGLESPEMAGMSFAVKLLAISVSAGFLYAVFAGILMWSESVRRVQESQRIAAREAVLRLEAEAKVVRAQFNPHFVFNTLHSLMLLVRADPAAAERAIEDVATLIRYASIVQRRDIDDVPLAKELEVARRYVALEALRLDDRLEVAWEISVDPAAVTVPAFSLQTLVENAIKHGIEPSPRGGRVEVSARTAAGFLELGVMDDGVGAPPERVSADPGHGLGLLVRRLENRYGAQGGLGWTTAPGEGFEARLRIPAERPEAEPALDVIEARQGVEGPVRGAVTDRAAGAGTDRSWS